MDDYIKREDVHLAFDSYYFPGKLSLRETIDSVPSADVRPVVRGKWMFEGSIENTYQVFTCSRCGVSCIDGGNFCTNCGADMRDENKI